MLPEPIHPAVTDASVGAKFRVLVVIRWPVGGIRTFLRYVFNCFDPAKYRFVLLVPDIPEIPVLRSELAGIDCAFVTVEPKPSPVRLGWYIARQVRREHYDLIYSQGITSGLCAAPVALALRIPHLLTCHELLGADQFRGISGRITRVLLYVLLPWIDCIHVVSDDARDNLLEQIRILRILRREILVSRNGIDIATFRNGQRRDFRRELGLPADSFLIGFLGRFMKVKGFRYLVEAVRELQIREGLPGRPVLLAIGSGGYLSDEVRYVRDQGLEECVRFIPFEANVAGALKGLDVLVMPSLMEACGLLAMEAMVAGVPVIGSDCPGLREVLRGTPGVLAPVADSHALAEALEREMRQPTRKIARDFSREAALRFNVTEQARILDAKLSNLIGRARTRRRSR